MRSIVTFPLDLFQQALLEIASAPHRSFYARLGVYESPERNEWLVRDLVMEPPTLPQQMPFLRIVATSEPPTAPTAWPEPVLGHLYVGDAWLRGHLYGFLRGEGRVLPVDELRLVGAGLHRLPALGGAAPAEDVLDEMVRDRWSRTIGALGGEVVWRRLIRLHIGVVGCGRSGSVIAGALVRLGVRRLTLIDPDLIETHNLGEMTGVVDEDVGQTKVEAIARHLRTEFSVQVMTVASPVHEREGLIGARDCDVLFCCADQDAARLSTALVATMYHRVLVDIGTGIRFAAQNGSDPLMRRELGADVRLIMPGDGCLLCRGNLERYVDAVATLSNARIPDLLEQEWKTQRAGSLASLNHLAAATGIRLLEDLVAERIATSQWLRLTYDEGGRLHLDYPTVGAKAACPLCARAGLGDFALGNAQSG